MDGCSALLRYQSRLGNYFSCIPNGGKQKKNINLINDLVLVVTKKDRSMGIADKKVTALYYSTAPAKVFNIILFRKFFSKRNKLALLTTVCVLLFVIISSI